MYNRTDVAEGRRTQIQLQIRVKYRKYRDGQEPNAFPQSWQGSPLSDVTGDVTGLIPLCHEFEMEKYSKIKMTLKRKKYKIPNKGSPSVKKTGDVTGLIPLCHESLWQAGLKWRNTAKKR